MTINPDRKAAALDWLVRTNDPEFDGWDEFTTWLEECPANAEAYHALADAEAQMLPFLDAVPAGSRPARVARPRRMALAAGIAVLAAAGAALLAPRMMPIDYSTGPGEVRLVSLGGQDELVLNGDTRLELAGWDRRDIRLHRGQLLLRLHEQDRDGVRVMSGDLELVDVGTVFEVSRDGRETRVLVSEGAVIADPGGARLKLSPGERLDTEDGASVLRAQSADASSVGSFERGQLAYVDEPLDNVVADLRRSTGLDFSANATISARRFTGTLSVEAIRRDPRSLEPLLGVPIERSGRGWNLGGKV
ncbi:FecR family protein [Sphingomonas xanthus]|uniref:FecR protein domain-containing protein n=1 Tax=Sphingomonas xanthus TaxID=2594473 RepID=A0A516IT50_9SPHN|nr:FecR domain-containing protein [Sphingomonas xanthus]QDP20088.1 hypothetical protein FMM02_09065 [Sphingomonas xanthus]